MPTQLRVGPDRPARARTDRLRGADRHGRIPPAQGQPEALPAAGRRARLARWVPALALCALTVLVTTRGIHDGGFRFSDASRHAMDGVFLHDFLVDLPDSTPAPIEYALRFYAQYPSLGIGLYYPPLFAVVEAVFFAVFGISAFTARLTVVAFAVLGTVMMYKLLRRIMGAAAGALAVALFLSLPTVVCVARATMLEMPTTAMILAATYFFFRYAEQGHRASAIWTGLLVAGAVLTKQTAAFVVPAFGAYLLIRRRWACLKDWRLWVGAAIVAIVLVPYFVVSFRHAHYLASRVGGTSSALLGKLRATWQGWSLSLGGPALIAFLAAAAGAIVWELVRPGVKATWLLVCLLGAFFAQCIYVGGGGTRYVFLILPVLVSFGPLLLWRTGLLRRRIALIPASVAVLALAGYGYAQPVQVMRGHAQAARELVERAGPSPFVLFDGHWDGDITFFVRMYDRRRRLVVLRGSKMLYAFASFPGSSPQTRIKTEDDIMQFLHRYAVRVIAVEEKPLINADTNEEIAGLTRLLRDIMVKRPEFELIDSCEITARAENTSLNGTRLLVYQIRNSPPEPAADELSIPLVGLGRSITIPLKGLGEPSLDRLKREGGE